MSPVTRIMLIGALGVVTFDAVAALLALQFGFSWAWAMLGEALLYVTVGFCGARAGGMGAGLKIGAVTAAADATAGWAVAWAIGPGQVRGAAPIMLVTVALVMVAGGLTLGAVGGYGARLLGSRSRAA
jgi:hypothetical protein